MVCIVDHITEELVPCLIIAAAAWCGFCARPSKSFGNSLPFFKVSDTSKGNLSQLIDNVDNGNRCRSIANTLNGSRCQSFNDVPCSQSLRDHISELPDEILFNILSRLSLRDVMRVAVLSKRWRNVCLVLPCLDLDWSVICGSQEPFHTEECELYERAYVNNVDQVLLRYKDRDIISLRFSFCLNKEYYIDVDRWMNFVATRENLVSLNLQFICKDIFCTRGDFKRTPDESYIISGAFLSGFSLLKDLYLNSCILKLEGDARLSKLVTLSLNYVVLEGTQWQCVLSRLSNIKWLQLRSCNLPEKLHIGANLWYLSFLMISRCPGLLEVELNSKNLTTFEYVGEVALKCSFLSAPKLENMYVFLLEKEFSGGESMFSNLAYSLSGLRTLFLSGGYPQIHKLPTSPAIYFRSVILLHMYMKNDDPEADLVQVLPCLLRSFPFLKQLNVNLPFVFGGRKREKLPAAYFHRHLKEIELSEFSAVWVEFASYLLGSAVMLEHLIIKKSTRCYIGCGKWCVLSRHSCEKERRCIYELLNGVAISAAACVTVADD